MCSLRGLFIGSYPNVKEPFRSVFFRELIYALADLGVECHVISCVPMINREGINRGIPDYTEEMTTQGNRIFVYYPKFLSFSAKQIGKFNTMYFTQRNIEKATLSTVKSIKCDFDFVYGHFFLGGGLTAANVGRKLNIPAYIAYGECSFETEIAAKYNIQKKDMKGVHGIIAVSSANKKDIENREFAADIPVELALNSIDEKIFHVMDRTECRAKLGIPQEQFVIGFVGYFIERKGAYRLWKACCDLDDVKMAFAGQGPLAPGEKNVVFCKPLKHEDIPVFLNAVDVFVLPTQNEGCCNAIIEAMACGKPIISSNLPFNWDLLTEKNSILIDPNSIEQIAEAVSTLRDQPKLRESMINETLNIVKELTLHARAKKILSFIKRTMNVSNN